ncbi:UbiA-like protein EboC [Robiginitalea sp. SC105]|uniref:UbiA-like protein EboC n=1 Tax=Robiginitalea sp. SC105 TaxID=2762332 RepID=UPI00163A6535|nr:UbiA-like protein EboC [Robiginitalea sp. SC105]MBC2840215.1 UbiA-like protein EboC [Robiginitalea sp. SC105]
MGRSAIMGYLQLMRLPNLPTAAADVLAGGAIAGVSLQLDGPFNLPDLAPALFGLILASVFLYAGGVVLNDVFDADVDARERPERPIPRGAVSRSRAAFFGGGLLLLGVVAASMVRMESGYIAAMLAAAILLYDSYAKSSDFLGPLVMGVCRGFNLWLGISILPIAGAGSYLWVPVVYIFAVTTISRGEVYGGNKKALILAALMYVIAIFGVGILVGAETTRFWFSLPFLALLALMVFHPLWRAYQINQPAEIRGAVKGGVLGIVALDAAWAAGYGGLWVALIILALLPLSRLLAARFAVT